MAIELENVLPSEIEKRSFEIITEELTQSGIVLDPEKAPVIKRCIHTSADFDYAAEPCIFGKCNCTCKRSNP